MPSYDYRVVVVVVVVTTVIVIVVVVVIVALVVVMALVIIIGIIDVSCDLLFHNCIMVAIASFSFGACLGYNKL